MGSPESYRLSRKGRLVTETCSSAIYCRNSNNNCISCSSLVVFAAVPILGTPGWVKWKSEFMLLSRKA